MEKSELKKGDRIKVKVATRNGWVKGWRVVTGRCLGQVTVRAQGTGDFMIRDEEISAALVTRSAVCQGGVTNSATFRINFEEVE